MEERNVLTIRETLQRSKKEGIPVSEYTLRRWVKDGSIRSTKAGRKALIYWPEFVEFLCGSNHRA